MQTVQRELTALDRPSTAMQEAMQRKLESKKGAGSGRTPEEKSQEKDEEAWFNIKESKQL